MATLPSNLERGRADPSREELMLKIQASILERCLRKEIQDEQSVEARCAILRQKIHSMEAELTAAGKAITARRCLEDSSRSEFDAIDHDDFLAWLATASRSASNTPQQEYATLSADTSRKRPSNKNDGFSVFSIVSSPGASDGSPHRAKRARYISKEAPPCLRCRILKKKCDASSPCSHCPSQGFDNESDFWKVLGCFRGHLRDMADIFCPDFARAPRRSLNPVHSGGIDAINFVLTKSRLSIQKKRRIMNLLTFRQEFFALSAETWRDLAARETLSRSAVSLDQASMDESSIEPWLPKFDAAWAVLQLVSMDRVYLGRTSYNFFTLIRLGNSYQEYDRGRWEIFAQAKAILRQSVEVYLLERLCSQVASPTGTFTAPFDPRSELPNTLVLVDPKEDVQTFLRNFEKLCAGRAKLTGSTQVATFFALLVFGIAKSVLLDAYALRSDYEELDTGRIDHMLRISSAYKGLISVFCWASKDDVILQDWDTDTEAPVVSSTLRDMVNVKSWTGLGWKGCKDYLLNLGTGLLSDGAYNGFLVQKFGIDKITKLTSRGEEDLEAPREAAIMGKPIQMSIMPTAPIRHGTVNSVDRAVQESLRLSEPQGSLPRIAPHSDTTTNKSPSFTYTSIQFVSDEIDDWQPHSRKHGGRTGALDSETLDKVREVRKVGACWNCWVVKVPCSEGLRCEKCQAKDASAALTYNICNRGTFGSMFKATMFPELMFNQYVRPGIPYYAKPSIWLENTTYARLIWGNDIEMEVAVSKFVPRDINTDQDFYHARDGCLLDAESLPFAAKPDTLPSLKRQYCDKLETLLLLPGLSFPHILCKSDDLLKAVLNIVQRYYEHSQDQPLLRAVLLLLLALRLGVRPSIFMDTSTQSTPIHELMTDSTQVYTSRYLNHQSKGIFFQLAMGYADEVCTRLERLIRSRDRSSWPVCFATMLILSMCLERLQTIAIVEIRYNRTYLPSISAEEPQNSCKALEDVPFGQLQHIFHSIYGTHKSGQGSVNPFTPAGRSTGEPFDEPSRTMIRDIEQTIFGNQDMLRQMYVHDRVLDASLPPATFEEENSGRLVSKFLMSFGFPSRTHINIQ